MNENTSGYLPTDRSVSKTVVKGENQRIFFIYNKSFI